MSQLSPVGNPTPPRPTYLVFHHYKKEIIHTDLVGVYPHLEMAKAAASTALQNELAKYQRAGLSGTFCKEINLELRGLITVTTKNGETAVSEFEIREEQKEVPNGQFSLQMTSLVVYNLLTRAAGIPSDHTMSGTLKQLTPPFTPSPDSAVVDQTKKANYHHPEEKDPHWAQSRLPLFRKRDERPLAGLETYVNRKDLVLRSSQSRDREAFLATSSQSTIKPNQPESSPPLIGGLQDIFTADNERSDTQAPATKLQPGKVKILKR
ncbi:hypothetical protein DM02DRAFT_709438 [Periconia macrospinosa]|uniref:Uncharacterized protein n=1 Tax=Periconia macrospinosa TaxID=97972 RepID=A0A2V1E853_9PLEO|nr:hypothetical protein DM02DRAFT_709438 [Periconia macrospinosa]